MEQAIKEKWAKALKSGKYIQGKGYLRSMYDKYCSLGVLCDIIDPNAWRYSPLTSKYLHLTGAGILAHSLQTEVGLKDEQISQLVKMNDSHDSKSFEEIADFILSPEFDTYGEKHAK